MKYYAFISGLPDLLFEEHRKVFTIMEFKDELKKLLSFTDKRIVKKLFLKHDNDNLFSFLKNGEENMIFSELGVYSQEEIIDMVEIVKDEDRKWNRKYPDYFRIFIETYLASEEEPAYFWEDYITGLYYGYLCKKTNNQFLRQWSELNMNIRNVLSFMNCRDNKVKYDHLIVGDNAVAQLLKTSHNPTHELIELMDYLEFVREIHELPDLLEKEQRIDLLLWEWIDENTFFHYFDIEKIMGYLFKLQIIERWRLLDKGKGEQIFRELVQKMKEGIKQVEQI